MGDGSAVSKVLLWLRSSDANVRAGACLLLRTAAGEQVTFTAMRNTALLMSEVSLQGFRRDGTKVLNFGRDVTKVLTSGRDVTKVLTFGVFLG